jgi:hypothetical protein
MTPTQTKLASVKNALSDVNPELRCIHTHALAIRLHAVALSEQVALYAARDTGDQGSLGHVANSMTHAIGVIAMGSELAGSRSALDAIEASELFKTSDKLITPMLAEIAALEAQDVAERLDLAQRQRNHATAVEAAKARALATIADDPEVLAAAAALK